MKDGYRVEIVGLVFFLAFLGASSPAPAQDVSSAARQGTPVTKTAKGTFDVKLAPQPVYNQDEDAKLARMSIDKQLHGDLEGVGKGEMLTAATDTKGSAVYVAIERVSGTLQGRRGTFVLHHTGIMTRGTPQLTITVVPDSGTGELSGIAGAMTIDIVEGKHYYTFEYKLPATASR